jgi:predicted GH43/DUF377 family glycosyl hydrolase
MLDMKILYLICLLLLLSACRHDNNQIPLKFKTYEHNPILSPGEPGSWDDLMVILPYVIRHDNVFNLFYTGFNVNGVAAIGLATSIDGYHFTRFGKNPVLANDNTGLDAFNVSSGIVVMMDSVWVMYYNGREMAGYGPGSSIGMATATAPAGHWTRMDTPVLITARTGDWDAGFVFPSSILALENGTYIMYYSGGAQFIQLENCSIGMATSKDGITWEKYNDPVTSQHPFAESDPVLKAGSSGDWDSESVWMASVSKLSDGFEMYYSGGVWNDKKPYYWQIASIGYAFSRDGIHWEKYKSNPVYKVKDDHFAASFGDTEVIIECPSLVIQDTLCFMYYYYGTVIGKIGLATARY